MELKVHFSGDDPRITRPGSQVNQEGRSGEEASDVYEYGPYDLHQVELSKQDNQRELKVFFGQVTFEGVSISVGHRHPSGTSSTLLRRLLASLSRKPGPALP